MANERLCPEHVRRRLLCTEPAREDLVLPFNPLLHTSDDHLYYQTGRPVEIMLRAWASQNIEEMPRLRRWMFASFFSVAAKRRPDGRSRGLVRRPAHNKALLWTDHVVDGSPDPSTGATEGLLFTAGWPVAQPGKILSECLMSPVVFWCVVGLRHLDA